MKAISVYAITRTQSLEHLQKLERQLSGRTSFLKMRKWEWESMRDLTDQLEAHMPEIARLRFFYSFQIPRLGKEFDLLQIKEDQILNIELKSGVVSDEAIRRQLLQNRYYLSVLGKPIRSYTYISSQKRLVRLTNHDHLAETDWGKLCEELKNTSKDYDGNIEELFRAELYLISPLTEPSRFLKKEYFLTAQQREIERQILKKIRTEKTGLFWFTGLPGTGKTLLLYDLAMKLSVKQQVCMIHCGDAKAQWNLLHERLQRIEYAPLSSIGKFSTTPISDCTCIYRAHNIHCDEDRDGDCDCNFDFSRFHAIFVDEAHLLSPETLALLLKSCKDRPIIFSSDCEDMISPEELDRTTLHELKNLSGIQTYHLTNRIRTNAELSFYIQSMMHLSHRRPSFSYPHISVVYANNESEADCLLADYRTRGYICERETQSPEPERVADRIAVLIDERYYYDEQGYLRSTDQSVWNLFCRLNQAKEELAFVVKANEAVYATLLGLLF